MASYFAHGAKLTWKCRTDEPVEITEHHTRKEAMKAANERLGRCYGFEWFKFRFDCGEINGWTKALDREMAAIIWPSCPETDAEVATFFTDEDEQ